MADTFDDSLESPIARTSDPESSHLAASAITKSGKRKRQVIRVLDLVMMYPCKTSLELSLLGELDRYVIARRLPELERGFLVRKGEQRTCSAGKRMAVTWFVDEEYRVINHKTGKED